VMIEFRWV